MKTALLLALLASSVALAQPASPDRCYNKACRVYSLTVTTGITAADLTLSDDLVVTDESLLYNDLSIYNGTSDTQPVLRLTDDTTPAIQMGVGGTTAFDVEIKRTATNTIAIDVGGGADEITLDATPYMTLATHVEVSGNRNVTFSGELNIQRKLFNSLTNSPTGGAVYVEDPQGFKIASQTLPTCTSTLEGTLLQQAGAGSVRTQMCMCTSDGAGSPAFAWQNLVTGTVATTTTCTP